MTKQPHYDVAIVGASIAGCTAATFFGRRGLKVALIEREADPKVYKKICTHYIQPSATPTIERLGLARPIEEAGGIRNGINIWTRWGWIRTSRKAAGGHPTYGYNIRRQKLDPMLRNHAANTLGVEFMPGLIARRLIHDGKHFTGVGMEGRDGKTREIMARLVVAADGRNSRIGELSGVQARVKPNNRFSYFTYYRDLPLASGTNSQIWFLEPDIAYTFPNDDGLTLLACFITNNKLAAWKSDIKGSFVRFFESLPEGPQIKDGKQVSEMLGMLKIPNFSRPAARSGIAFIGDAALAADPLWGLGCGWAFQSAEWLVNCTADALLADGDLDRALERYRKHHRWELRGHYFITSDYSTGRAFNLIDKLFYSAAAKDAVMARHIDAFGTGNIGAMQLLSPTALARVLWVNMTRREQSP